MNVDIINNIVFINQNQHVPSILASTKQAKEIEEKDLKQLNFKEHINKVKPVEKIKETSKIDENNDIQKHINILI